MLHPKTYNINSEKKIVLILPNFKGGGAEKVMITLANIWASKSIRVYFLVGEAKGEFLHLLSNQVEVYDLKASKFSNAIPEMIRKLKKINPDVVLSTLIYCNVVSTIAVKLSRINTKLILREATTPSKGIENKPLILRILAKNLYKLADKFIAVSNGVKTDMISFYNLDSDRVEVINNPIITPDIFSLAKEEITHDFFNSGEVVITTLGKVSIAKDYLTLVEAFALVRKMKLKAKLLIIGRTNSAPQLFDEIKNKIRLYNMESDIDFCGFQSNPFPYLKKSDLFVLSSAYEGSPGALVQAMALNCKLVSTDCPSGPKEILNGGKYGKLVPVKDPLALSKAILETIKTPNINVDNQNNIALYKAEYSAIKYLEAFNNIVE